MKWAFLLGSPDISGGSYVIFEHAIRATKKGVLVTIITEEKINMERLHWHPEARSLIWKTYKEVENDKFDVCIATWWRTVYELYRVTAETYAYFVQSIESRFYDENERSLRHLVDSTYQLPLHIITEAKWIQKHLNEHFNKDAKLVPNGIRKDIYSIEGVRHQAREEGKLRVLVEGPIDVPFKNVPKTIEICKQSDADEVWLLTSSPISSYPGVDKVFSQVPIFETAQIYRSCDVIIKLSYVEGMFGPPLEMFHCGGTSITYNVTGHDEYIVSDQNALVAAKDDDKAVLNFINSLKHSPTLLRDLKDKAIDTANNWPAWDESSEQFYKAVKSICEDNSLFVHNSKDIIEKKSKFYFQWYVIAEESKSGNSGKPNISDLQFFKSFVRRKFPVLFRLLRNIKYKMKVRAINKDNYTDK
ncbi:glycosyltransferase involved in cell wall biosynthesis [Paenibacillus polymyxa]|uniref:glycosyltransferase n=1 Tax=Paenibacillus polymyxa TaxID=1406 RepID=UPI0027919137|nr:glycosyltransferase [Paenibacillus polymyxa]MDQ0049011.1 glycosyltransferase involved in cell wall biosynthesis [Paenibacillus polymyxa]